MAARSGIGWITHFDASKFPTKFASEVKDFQLSKYIPDSERFKLCGRNIHFAIGAAVQAVNDAGLNDFKDLDPAMFGVYLGAGEGAQDFNKFMTIIASSRRGDECDLAEFAKLGLETLDGESELQQEPNMTSGHLPLQCARAESELSHCVCGIESGDWRSDGTHPTRRCGRHDFGRGA